MPRQDHHHPSSSGHTGMATRSLALKMKTPARLSSFASDIHVWVESDSGIEIPVSMSNPRAICDTVSDLIDEVAKHLRKTQIKQATGGQE